MDNTRPSRLAKKEGLVELIYSSDDEQIFDLAKKLAENYHKNIDFTGGFLDVIEGEINIENPHSFSLINFLENFLDIMDRGQITSDFGALSEFSCDKEDDYFEVINKAKKLTSKARRKLNYGSNHEILDVVKERILIGEDEDVFARFVKDIDFARIFDELFYINPELGELIYLVSGKISDIIVNGYKRYPTFIVGLLDHINFSHYDYCREFGESSLVIEKTLLLAKDKINSLELGDENIWVMEKIDHTLARIKPSIANKELFAIKREVKIRPLMESPLVAQVTVDAAASSQDRDDVLVALDLLPDSSPDVIALASRSDNRDAVFPQTYVVHNPHLDHAVVKSSLRCAIL